MICNYHDNNNDDDDNNNDDVNNHDDCFDISALANNDDNVRKTREDGSYLVDRQI